MQEQLAKIQQDMMDKMLESQRNMMTQLTQLFVGVMDKGKGPMANPGEEEPFYPPSRSGSNPGDNPTNPVILDFNEVAEKEKAKEELTKQLEDKCKWLEEKFKVIESVDSHHGIDAKDLSLVPDLLLPYKFKMPEFETLVGATSKWYNQLRCSMIGSWRDLAQAFMKQYSHVTDMTLDRITLQNMEKKSSESFRQYAQRWREIAIQASRKKTTILFINTLKVPFITHMLGSAIKSFSNIVMNGEMIENAIRNGKIDAGESNKRSALRKKKNEVNNTSTYNKGYSKSITVNQPRKVAAGQQRQESGTKQNTEKLQFTPISMTYRELYQSLFDAHVVSPFYLKPMQPPYPKWYDANAQCEYHAGIMRHSIENCTAFKKLVERLINMGIFKFDDPSNTENPLPNHIDDGINAMSEDMGRRIKIDIAEIKTPLRWVWNEMVKKGSTISNSGGSYEKMRNYYEFHHEVGHEIQKCNEFRALVQDLMDNNELESMLYLKKQLK
ncbi:uncharacterized protein LOC105787041 [Gossypium raimondii]|uniref:uncharacterized protein LOC105787041 n=1 Tax=Gossypium raimondii TaxID=29730 RepID=UPI00063AAE9D|nr:uncharacterized protein LOC105787041 [Gossypium raimondii]